MTVYHLYALFGAWNFGIAFLWVSLVTGFCRGGGRNNNANRELYRVSVLIFVIPASLIGLAIPIYYVLQLDLLSQTQKIIFIIVTFVLPYSFWAIRINCPTRWGGEEAYNQLRETPCFTCLRKHDEEDEEDLEDSRIIFKKVVQGDGTTKLQSPTTKCSFSSNHPKSDIVLNLPKKSEEDNDSTSCNIDKKSSQLGTKKGPRVTDEESLYPIQLPTDIKDLNKEEPHTSDGEDAEDISNSSEGVSDSVPMCSICLEEYKVGEEIGWSRNSECHHAFHKDCIIEWLANNDDCPICRKAY